MKVAEDQVVEDDSSFQDDEVRFEYYFIQCVLIIVSLFKEEKNMLNEDLP